MNWPRRRDGAFSLAEAVAVESYGHVARLLGLLRSNGGRTDLLQKAVSSAHREGYITGAHAARLRQRIKTVVEPSVGGPSRNER